MLQKKIRLIYKNKTQTYISTKILNFRLKILGI